MTEEIGFYDVGGRWSRAGVRLSSTFLAVRSELGPARARSFHRLNSLVIFSPQKLYVVLLIISLFSLFIFVGSHVMIQLMTFPSCATIFSGVDVISKRSAIQSLTPDTLTYKKQKKIKRKKTNLSGIVNFSRCLQTNILAVLPGSEARIVIKGFHFLLINKLRQIMSFIFILISLFQYFSVDIQ